MRTRLDIEAELIKKVMKATGAPSKKKAIEMAMKEFLRAKRRRELSDLIGSYEDFDVTLKDLKKMRKGS
jgi:Arc/MetJ family transcription regulator